MKLFERREDTDLYRLAFEQGQAQGILAAKLDALLTELAAVRSSMPKGEAFQPMEPEIIAAIDRLSRAQPDLYRFLEKQARELIGVGLSPDAIVQRLELGSRAPKLEKRA